MWKIVLPTAAMATSFAGPKQHLDFEAMADNFRSINQKQKEGQTINQNTFDSVRNFIGQISNVVKGALETDRDYAQSIYNKSKADVEECDSDRSSTKTHTVDPKTGEANKADSDWDTCKDEEQTAHDNMTHHCEDCDQYVSDWNSEHCAAVNFQNGDSDAVETYMTCICKFVEDHKDIYYEKRQNCTDATTMHTNKVAECGNPGLQADMDAAFCAEQVEIQTMCRDYKTCRGREEGELSGIKSTVEQWEDVMQAQRVALEQLICFGNHILDNNTDLAGCDDLAQADCTSYTDCPTIIYPAAADRVNCTEPSTERLPCEQAYKNNIYTPSNATDTPHQTCVPCSLKAPFPSHEAEASPAPAPP